MVKFLKEKSFRTSAFFPSLLCNRKIGAIPLDEEFFQLVMSVTEIEPKVTNDTLVFAAFLRTENYGTGFKDLNIARLKTYVCRGLCLNTVASAWFLRFVLFCLNGCKTFFSRARSVILVESSEEDKLNMLEVLRCLMDLGIFSSSTEEQVARQLRWLLSIVDPETLKLVRY